MPVYEGNLGTVKADTGIFNHLRSGKDATGSNADLVIGSANSIVFDPGRDVRVGSDLIVSGVTSLAQDPSNSFLGTRLVESQAGQDLILRPGRLARVCIDGDLMITRDFYGTDIGSNSLANTMLLDSNAVVLGTEIHPDYDTIDQGGLLMRSALFETDPKLVSLLWNKNADGTPYWNVRGGNLALTRTVASDQLVTYTFAIQDDLSLVLLRQVAGGAQEPCVCFLPSEN